MAGKEEEEENESKSIVNLNWNRIRREHRYRNRIVFQFKIQSASRALFSLRRETLPVAKLQLEQLFTKYTYKLRHEL